MFPPFLLCRGISLFLWNEEGGRELVVRSPKEEGVDFVQLLHYCHSIITIQN